MIKLLGSILIIGSASWVGLRMAGNVRREERLLKCLAQVLEVMECEITTRLTPAGALCVQAANLCDGALGELFKGLAIDIEAQTDGSIGDMMEARLHRYSPMLPDSCRSILIQLGQLLGGYETEAQRRALDSLSQQTEQALTLLRQGRAERCRSYEVMGVCAGCALAILLV